MEITAKDVAKLREITGVGLMACKKALIATDGDIDRAIEYLREQGIAVAAKKASRIAAEGAVWAGISADKHAGALVEINCESDFVAKSDVFVDLCKLVSQAAVDNFADATAEVLPEQLIAVKVDGTTIEELINTATSKTGEKISLRRIAIQKNVGAIEEAYIHLGGKIGTLVEVKCDGTLNAEKTAEVVAMAHNIAMHVTAFQPPYISKADVPEDAVNKEREIIHQQLLNDEKNKNKPEQVLAKIAENKLGKFYEANCLLYQEYVMDASMTVEQYIASVAKSVGVKLEVVRFVKFIMGEGIEKRSDNLAEEVAKLAGK